MKKKRCPACWIVKDVFEFSKDKNRKDGLMWQCKECRHVYEKKYRNNPKSRHRTWVRMTLYHHKKRGFQIDITKDELTEFAKKFKNCPICGCVLTWDIQGKQGGIPSSPTLDRLNNERIINKDNILIICHQCNMAKGTRTLKEFYEYCKMVTSILEELIRNYGVPKA